MLEWMDCRCLLSICICRQLVMKFTHVGELFCYETNIIARDIGPHLQVAKKIDCHRYMQILQFLNCQCCWEYLNHYINWLFWCKCIHIFCVVFHYSVLMWPLSVVKDISHISSEVSHGHDCYCIFKISNLYYVCHVSCQIPMRRKGVISHQSQNPTSHHNVPKRRAQ
jgi:hypothetical protein